MGWIAGIIIIMSFLICLFIILIKRMLLYRNQRNSNREIYLLLMQWLTMRIDGNSIEQKLINMGARNIIIYGMGILGDQLLYELQGSSQINVVYTVDANPANASSRVSTKKSIEDLDDIDTIIISDIFADTDIVKHDKTDQKVISLLSLVYD